MIELGWWTFGYVFLLLCGTPCSWSLNNGNGFGLWSVLLMPIAQGFNLEICVNIFLSDVCAQAAAEDGDLLRHVGTWGVCPRHWSYLFVGVCSLLCKLHFPGYAMELLIIECSGCISLPQSICLCFGGSISWMHFIIAILFCVFDIFEWLDLSNCSVCANSRVSFADLEAQEVFSGANGIAIVVVPHV
jgi:hypothetical protein